MDLVKNDNVFQQPDNFRAKKKKRKRKKEITKQIKEDHDLYLENKDPVAEKKTVRQRKSYENVNEDFFELYDIVTHEENSSSVCIIKKDSFTLNNDLSAFDNSTKNIKNVENIKLNNKNNKNNKNNYYFIEEEGEEEEECDNEVNKNIKNDEIEECDKNNKNNKNKIKKNNSTLKFDDVKDLELKINDINEYSCIKTSFKTNGESLLNNEISKKYNKKKSKESNAISDKLRDTFKKLVMKDTKSRPNLSNILLTCDFDDNTKIRLIKKYIKYSTEDDHLSEQADKIKLEIENIIKKKESLIIDDDEQLTIKIKEKFIPDKLKLKLENLNIRAQATSSVKLQNYINDILKIPYNNKKSIIDELNNDESKKMYIQNIYNKLNDKLFGLQNVKNSILSYFCLKLNNPTVTNKKFLCLCGPPGVGKTSIVQALSEAIDIPYSYISMANVNDSSILLGHSYTFEGSIYGSLSSSLINNDCKNGIIIFDELDKCNEKVQKTMLGIFDPLQNNKFVDAYFNDFYLDLSETLMIICVNSVNEINPYLRDRFHIVNIEGYSDNEKKNIIDKFVIPKFNKEYNINIDIEPAVISHILYLNRLEKGVRKISIDISKIYELIIVDKYMNNFKMNNKFTMKDISKLHLIISDENKHRDSMYI
jgi:ATP-dependent Lon protease